jgi:hypothetical protein
MRNDIREETGYYNLDSALLDLIRETKRRSPDKYKRAMRLAKNGLHTDRMVDDFVNLITRSTGGSYTEKQWRSLMTSAKRRYGKLHGRIATRRTSRDGGYRVILLRGAKGEKVWDDKTKARAQERADSLAELHGISLGMIQERDNTFIVDASNYYTPRKTSGDASFSERTLLQVERTIDNRASYLQWKRTYKKNQPVFTRIHKLTRLEWGAPTYRRYLGKLRKRLVQLVRARKVTPSMARAFYADILYTGT